MATHKGECFCGAVEIEVSGEPEGMGYCHCRSCRSWSVALSMHLRFGSRVNAVQVIKGIEHIDMFQKTAASERHFCKECGGHFMADHPPLRLVDVYAATLPT